MWRTSFSDGELDFEAMSLVSEPIVHCVGDGDGYGDEVSGTGYSIGINEVSSAHEEPWYVLESCGV